MKIRKILLTLLLGFAIIFPSKVLAEVKEVKNEEEFKTAITDGNDVKLTDNIKITDIITVDKKVTIDLNDKNINVALKKYILVKGGNLNITGTGTLAEEEAYFSPIVVKGSENKEDTNYTTLTIGENVTLKGWAGIFIDQVSSDKKFGYGITANIYGTLISVADTAGDKGHGIYINGNIKDKENAPVINVYKGAKINSEGDAIYAAGYGNWNIEGATFYGGLTGLAIKSGVFKIKDTIVKTDGVAEDPSYNGNGVNSDGSAIQIESNNGYAGGINITITGGTYESVNNHAIEHYLAKKNETDVVTSKLESLVINGGTFKGTIKVVDTKDILINKGNFTAKIDDYVKDNYKVVQNSDKTYSVENIFVEEKENVTTKVLVGGKETKIALEGETVVIENTIESGYYLKSASYKIVGEETEYRIIGNQFTMPAKPVTIVLEIAKCENQEDKLVLLPITPEVDESIETDVKKELTEAKLDNSKTGLLEAIEVSELEYAANAYLVEVKLNTTLKSYDKDNKTLVFDIKPVYLVDNDEVGVVPNSAIKGKIKIKLPVLNDITDTHVKVIHKSGDTIVDTKEYEIKEENGQKYVEIETESFSTFELNFYTPTIVNNPQTLDSLTIYLIAVLVSSIMFIAIVMYLKKEIILKK